MSNMFAKYTESTVQPTNYNQDVKHVPECRPYEDYNAQGKLVGYYWYYGNTVNLQFIIDGEITVGKDAIIYNVMGEHPNTTTMAELRTKAYNIIDMKSWTLMSIIEDENGKLHYNWVEDKEFNSQIDGSKNVYLSAESYLKDKEFRIEIYNFRYEQIYTQTVEAANVINFAIDEELSAKMVKGVYYCRVCVLKNDSVIYLDLVEDADCMLTVK